MTNVGVYALVRQGSHFLLLPACVAHPTTDTMRGGIGSGGLWRVLRGW